MKMKLFLAGLLSLLAVTASAEVTRETDTGSVAGVLEPSEAYDDFTFRTQGNEILFADIDSGMYQTEGRATHEYLLDDVCTQEDGGCSDEGSGEDGICLQVLDPEDTVMCWASRPMRPGWMTDPRLACELDEATTGNETYTLRVGRRIAESSCGPDTAFEPVGDDVLYLLNVSLRRAVDDGSLSSALGRSRNSLQ